MADSNHSTELQAAQAAALQNPQSADNWNRLAIAFLKEGDLASAVENIGKAIALEPKEALHYSNRGRILFALERAAESLTDYSKAIELAPSAELYSSRSVVHIALNQDAAALDDLNEALERDRSVENLLNRASFFANKGLAADAMRDVSEVIERQPDKPDHRLTRANLAFALARHYPDLYEMGLTDIEQALQLDQTGVLHYSLLQLADQLEAYIAGSPSPEVSRRLIDLIRSKS